VNADARVLATPPHDGRVPVLLTADVAVPIGWCV
jgi:hypothetical protein